MRTGNGARSAGAGALRVRTGFARLTVLHSGFAHCTMKTQLFLDLQESGSTPEPPKPQSPPRPASPKSPAARSVPDDAAAPPRQPAVWQGPGAQRAGGDATMQQADVGTMQRAPDTAARGVGVAIESWADRAAQSRPASAAPAPVMPQPRLANDAQTLPGRPARQDALPPPPTTAPAAAGVRVAARPDLKDVPQPEAYPHPRVDTGAAARPDPFDDDVTIPRASSAVDDADWLAARLAAQAVQPRTPAWDRFWKRRVAMWSIAGGLLAGVAAGGLWLYEAIKVDGAPGVVAATAPATGAPATAVNGAPPPAAAQAVAPTPPPAVQPAASTDMVRPLPEVAAAVSPAPDAADRSVKTVDTTTAQAADVEPPRRAPRQEATARKRQATKTTRARTHDTAPVSQVAAEPSARQRREELLMQCRAHGYDERRCFQRACTMTRYGLVCRG